MPPPNKHLIKLNKIALSVGAVFAVVPLWTWATEYTTPITGNESGYENIRLDTGSEIIYNFKDEDSLNIENVENAIEARNNKSLALPNDLTISISNESNNYVLYSRALYSFSGSSITADDLEIKSASVQASHNGYAIAVGLDATVGSIKTKNVLGEVRAFASEGTKVGQLQAMGIKVASGGQVVVDGNAEFSLTAKNLDQTGSTEYSNIAGAVLEPSPENGKNILDVSGQFSVTGSTDISSASSSSQEKSAMAAGVFMYGTGQVNLGSLFVDISATYNGQNAVAEVYGVGSAPDKYNGHSSFISGQTDIHLVAKGENGARAQAVGIMNTNAVDIALKEGDIEVSAMAESNDAGFATAAGIYTIGGVVDKGSGNINVDSNGTSFGIFASDNATVNYAGGKISAKGYDATYEAGLYVTSGSIINLLGDTEVEAGNAIAGDGTILIAKNTTSGLNGLFDSFTGEALINGHAALGMSSSEAKAYFNSSDAASLALRAGSTLEGSYIVGSQAQSSGSSGSSLTILSDGSLIIVADGNYDGTTALVTVDTASIDSQSTVRLYNSAQVNEGTTIFNVQNTSETLVNFNFETDNLLVGIANNKVVKKSVESVFGPGLLIPSVIEEAQNAEGLGAERLIDITSGSMDIKQTTQALNNVALMGAAAGAQIAALNATQMIDETIAEHRGILKESLYQERPMNLWVNLNGLFSQADDYSVGNTSYGFKSDLAGLTVGADHTFDNGLVAGAALSVGTGSVRGQGIGRGIKNEVDYWGVNFYGLWMTPYADLLASIGYLSSDNEIRHMGFGAEPDARSVSVSLRAEKNITLNDRLSLVPHIGVRWLNTDADSFSAGGFKYKSEKVDLFQIPVGVAIVSAFETGSGYRVNPVIDLEVTSNIGDTDIDNQVKLLGGTLTDVFETQINSDVIYSAKLGLNISKKQHSFSLNYKGAMGSQDRIDQRLQATYRFMF